LVNIWARKSTAELAEEAAHAGTTGNVRPLRRSLSALNLTALGVGGIVGAGIFVLTGHAAAATGPAMS
jgi:basic amino acid/polyamine antiporter, APA family